METNIHDLITGAKNLFDLIENLTDKLKGREDELKKDYPSINDSIFGSDSGALDANASVAQHVSKVAVPFILRVGRIFQLPSDVLKMEEAISKKDFWNWTYVYDLGHKNPNYQTLEHLKKLYCDENRKQKLRAKMFTTTLSLSEETFEINKTNLLGDSLCITGVALTSSRYDHIFNIPQEDLLPNIVIKAKLSNDPKTKEETDINITSYTDPIIVNLILHQTIRFIFERFSEGHLRRSFVIEDETEEKITLPDEMARLLKFQSVS